MKDLLHCLSERHLITDEYFLRTKIQRMVTLAQPDARHLSWTPDGEEAKKTRLFCVFLRTKQQMDSDDFLWQCAFQEPGKDRLDIIPDRLELSLGNGMVNYLAKHFYFSINETEQEETPPNSDNNEIKVIIYEEKGSGVVDIIGGEVWEAALLLCGHMALHLENYLQRRCILELGSGVGLPLLYLANKLCRARSSALKQLIFSDYDPRLLSTLSLSIPSQLRTHPHPLPHSTCLSVLQVDWSDASSYSFVEEVDLIIGSALCYAPVHASYLHQVIGHYIRGRECKQILIVQISDREGYKHLISMLEQDSSLYTYQLQEVEREVYDYANRVRRRALAHGNNVGEEEGRVGCEYFFPTEGGEREEKEGKGMMRTEREAFSLLTITSILSL